MNGKDLKTYLELEPAGDRQKRGVSVILIGRV